MRFSRELPPLSAARQFRLERRVRLIDAAVFSGVSLVRASEIERNPSKARPGELERLKAAVEKVAANREAGS